MIAVAGDLRRDAGKVTQPDLAAKNLETQALAKAGLTSPHIGRLLDTFA